MYKIKIYKAAKRDLCEVVDYLNAVSPKVATKYYDLIIEQIGTLAEMPERCALVRDAQLRLRGYRVLMVEKYMVFFCIRDNIVQIRRILYGRRQYEWMM